MTMQKYTKLIDKMFTPIVIATTLVVFGLIMVLAQGQSVWFDEGYSILLAKRPISELLSLTGVDAHPPLYYLLLKLWAGLFGWSETALRSLSAVLTALTAGTALYLIRATFTKRIALAVVPFLIASPFLLRYGYEIRMYALAGLICVAATYALVRGLQTGKRVWWIVYAGFIAIGIYTLYMTVALWLTQFVWLTVRTVKARQIVWKQPWFYAYAGAVVLFVPYLPTFIHQMLHSALPGIGSEVTLVKLVGVAGFVINYIPSWQVGGWFSLAFIALFTLAIYIYIRLRRVLGPEQKLWFGLLVTCFFGSILFFALTSLPPRAPIFVERYMAHIVVFAYILLGLIAALGFRQKLYRTTTVFAVLSFGLLVSGTVQLMHTGNFNWERLQMPQTRQVRANVTCGDDEVVVADDPYTYIDSVYYFDSCHEVFYSKDPIAYKGGYAPLSNSLERVSTADNVQAKTLYHLHWDGQAASFVPTNNYHLVASQTFDKQIIDTYVRD